MNEELERIYGEALDLLEQGTSPDAIMARYPGYAADLRPFLQAASALTTLATQPGLTAEQRSKRAFLAAAAEAGRGQGRRGPALYLSRLLAPALAVLVVVVLGGAVLVGRSGAALPGSALYETKRLVEDVRLGLAADPEQAAGLRERFRRERAREVERLLAAGATADVTLTGVVEAVVADPLGERWTVAGLPVLVTAATEVGGVAGPGALVEIIGRTEAGLVRAARVMLLTGAPAAATPPPVPPTAAPGPASPAVATPAETVTPSLTATSTDTPAATASPTMTMPLGTSTPAPATSTPDGPGANDNGDNGDDNQNDNGDNGNDNGDDNQNDNSDESDDSENDNSDNSNGNDNGDHNNNDNANDNHNDNTEGGD